jgi:hypothetical protein
MRAYSETVRWGRAALDHPEDLPGPDIPIEIHRCAVPVEIEMPALDWKGSAIRIKQAHALAVRVPDAGIDNPVGPERTQIETEHLTGGIIVWCEDRGRSAEGANVEQACINLQNDFPKLEVQPGGCAVAVINRAW